MKLIPHNKPTFGKSELTNVSKVIQSGNWSDGKITEKLEKRLQQRFNVKHAVAVSNGLSALRLALLALNVSVGSKVIVPAYCCVAIPNAVKSVGAVPIPVDCRKNDFNINTNLLISKDISAIIVVNTFGTPANIQQLKKHKIPIIEDASHGFYINSDGSTCELKSDLMVLSFYTTKLIGCGEGGCVLTNNKNYSDFVKYNKNYVDKPSSSIRLNDKLSNIHSAIAIAQIDRLKAVIKRREYLSSLYYKRLYNSENIILQTSISNRIHYRFIIQIRNEPYNKIKKFLDKKGIIVEAPVANWITDIKKFKVSNSLFKKNISLPLFSTLSIEQLEYVTKTIKLYARYLA